MKTSYIKAFINDGTKGEPIPAYVLSMDESEEVIVNASAEDKDLDTLAANIALRLWEGKMVEIGILKGRDGVMLYTGKVSYVLRERIHIQILSFQGTLQRRMDAKARFSAQGIIEAQFACEIPHVPVTFRDISSGGIGFFVDQKFAAGLVVNKKYKTEFDRSVPPITLFFDLLWKNEMEDDRVNCGGRFYNVNSSSDVLIRKFVFDREREERKRMLEEIELEELAAERAAEEKIRREKETKEQEGREAREKEARAARARIRVRERERVEKEQESEKTEVEKEEE